MPCIIMSIIIILCNNVGEFGVVYKGHIVKDLGRTVTEVVAIKTLKGLCHQWQCFTVRIICISKKGKKN